MARPAPGETVEEESRCERATCTANLEGRIIETTESCRGLHLDCNCNFVNGESASYVDDVMVAWSASYCDGFSCAEVSQSSLRSADQVCWVSCSAEAGPQQSGSIRAYQRYDDNGEPAGRYYDTDGDGLLDARLCVDLGL